MPLAVDCTSSSPMSEFHQCTEKMEGAAFFEAEVEVFPYQIATLLTWGLALADLPKNREGPAGASLDRISSTASASPTASRTT